MQIGCGRPWPAHLDVARCGAYCAGADHPQPTWCRSGLQNAHDLEFDRHLVADEDATTLEGDVPGQTELLAGDRGLGSVSRAGLTGRSGAVAIELSGQDRKSTRLNSSHVAISYAGLCWK